MLHAVEHRRGYDYITIHQGQNFSPREQSEYKERERQLLLPEFLRLL